MHYSSVLLFTTERKDVVQSSGKQQSKKEIVALRTDFRIAPDLKLLLLRKI